MTASVATATGLDLSLTSTGVCILDGDDVALHTITSRPAGDGWAARRRRLTLITSRIVALTWVTNLVVVEGPAYSKTTGAQHDRAGLWWMVVNALYDNGCYVAVVPPTSRAKYATGKGNSGKDAVLAAAVRRYTWVPIGGNDEADATILAAMGRRFLGSPVDDPLPAVNRGAMAGGAWPT